MPESSRSDLVRLRKLLPAILIATGIANALCRFVPPAHVAFRSWEAATLFVTGIGPFAPNMHYVNPTATGDLPSLGNLPSERRAHFESFTTGAQGFRTYDADRDGQAAAVLIGDSFGAGAALADDDYLGRRLSEVVCGPAFFGGQYGPNVTTLWSRIPRAPLTIIQLSERSILDDRVEPDSELASRPFGSLLRRGTRLSGALHYARDLPNYSPLEIWANRAYKRLQNDVVLPNIYQRSVVGFRLVNGERMLFLRSELEHRERRPPVRAGGVIRFWRELERAGTRGLVVIVPDKLSVYGGLLPDAPPEPPELYADGLDRELRQAGIPVVNLLPPLKHAAEVALRTSNYVYHLDDTHWNKAGVEIAVLELRKALRWPRCQDSISADAK